MEISFVLVEPAVPENIGAAARALVACGFDDLVLVRPEGHRDERATWLAVGAQEVLKRARVYASLDEAVAGHDLVIGTTARHRTFSRPLIESDRLVDFIREKNDPGLKIALVFGSEQSGLSNQDLALCQVVTTARLAAPYPSFNLAQAVMLYAYELSRASLESGPGEDPDPDFAGLGVFLDKTTQLLGLAGVRPDENAHRRILEFAAHFNHWEIQAFHVLWGRLIEKLGRP